MRVRDVKKCEGRQGNYSYVTNKQSLRIFLKSNKQNGGINKKS